LLLWPREDLHLTIANCQFSLNTARFPKDLHHHHRRWTPSLSLLLHHLRFQISNLDSRFIITLIYTLSTRWWWSINLSFQYYFYHCPSLTFVCLVYLQDERRLMIRNGRCKAVLLHDAPFAGAIGACILNSLIFPPPVGPNDNEDADSMIDSADARFAVMGIISFIPYFNWMVRFTLLFTSFPSLHTYILFIYLYDLWLIIKWLMCFIVSVCVELGVCLDGYRG